MVKLDSHFYLTLDQRGGGAYLDFRHGDGDVSRLNGELHALIKVGGEPLRFSCSFAPVLTRTTACAEKKRQRRAVRRDREKSRGYHQLFH